MIFVNALSCAKSQRGYSTELLTKLVNRNSCKSREKILLNVNIVWKLSWASVQKQLDYNIKFHALHKFERFEEVLGRISNA